MPKSDDITTVDFDHHSSDYAARSAEVNHALHEAGTVAWSEHHGGFWLVNGYEEIRRIERDMATFSSDHDMTGDGSGYDGIVIPPQPFRAVPIEVDPPAFTAYRALLSPYFTRGAARGYRPFVEQTVDWALDRICEEGSGDLVLDLANPVPGILTCAVLGLPVAEWERYAMPAHQIVYAPPGSELQQSATVGAIGMMQDIHAAVLDRRENPADDLITMLVQAEVNGEALADQTLVEMIFLVIFGGVDTTTGLTANTLRWLSNHTEQARLLSRDPERWPKATEEFLRYFSPVQGQARTVTGDTTVSGCPMSAGDRVHLNFGAANRDPSAFDDPQSVDLERHPNIHAAFGLGPHRCLGQHVARVMYEAMVGGVLRRLPDFAVDEEKARRYQTIGTVNGWETMPVTFSASLARGVELPTPPGLLTAESAKAVDG